MHLYLSSFRIGDRVSELQALAEGRELGFIPNALDFLTPDGRAESNARELDLYAGYSAGVCVLAPRLDGLQHVDDPEAAAYPDSEVIWEGLGILDHLILPHYKSDHHESSAIDVEVDYCTRHGIPFETYVMAKS